MGSIKKIEYTDNLFCRYCKGMLLPKDIDGKTVLYCRKCDQPYEMEKKNRKDFVFKTDIKPSAD